jgi:hypothetical protein
VIRLGKLGQMIKLLMRALGSESIRAKLYACATVWHLTKTESARMLLIDAGVVERLLVRDRQLPTHNVRSRNMIDSLSRPDRCAWPIHERRRFCCTCLTLSAWQRAPTPPSRRWYVRTSTRCGRLCLRLELRASSRRCLSGFQGKGGLGWASIRLRLRRAGGVDVGWLFALDT